MKPLMIIGNGGHSKVIRDMVKAQKVYEVKGILDDNFSEKFSRDNILHDKLRNIEIYKNDYYFVIAIGSNHIRKKIVSQIQLPKIKYAKIIHPDAIISESATIGFGTVVMPGVIINASSKIGNHVIINTGSIVEHDNDIHDYVHISPNATLTGTVLVGECTHIGASATVIPNLSIGKSSIIGAGATVISEVRDNETVVGTPAKVIKE